MAEEKTRIHTRISPDTRRKMGTAMPNANCQSQNEFVERAICFYSDYLVFCFVYAWCYRLANQKKTPSSRLKQTE